MVHPVYKPLVLALALAFALLTLSVTRHAAARGPSRAQAKAPSSPAPTTTTTTTGGRGWFNPEAFDLMKQSVEAKVANDMLTCVQKGLTSLALEEHPYVRLHLSSCQATMGKLVDALVSARTALAAGIRNDDSELTSSAQKRVADLLPRLAHVSLQLPKNAEGTINVTFDGIPVRPHLLRQRVAVDPGNHIVTAERVDVKPGEQRASFKETFALKEGEDRVVEVIVKPNNLSDEERECAEKATSYEEKLACFEHKSTKPNARVGLEMSGYSDSLAVHVLSPAINASVVSPTGGWNVGGSYLLDVVTAASPDIVSMASRRFREQRHAASLSGGYKIGGLDPQVHGNVSSEPDYVSMTGGGSLATELGDKSITPRVGYSFSRDRIGIRSTPFSQYEKNLATHEIEGGVTFILSPTTLLVVGLTLQIQRGEQSKLYRFVPLFSDAQIVRGDIKPGMSVEDVNAARDNARARETLPRDRDRYAAGARINHRMGNATLRIDERLYVDSWSVLASTTDARYLIDLSERFRVWPHLRLHAQTGANFYRLAYPVRYANNGAIDMYSYRTGDRELSQMLTVTAGGGTRIQLSPTGASVKYAVTVSGEVMWSKFLESLFVSTRTALYGTVGFEVEL